MKAYQFIHQDGNKEYNNREYSKDFESEAKAFEYLFQRKRVSPTVMGAKTILKIRLLMSVITLSEVLYLLESIIN